MFGAPEGVMPYRAVYMKVKRSLMECNCYGHAVMGTAMASEYDRKNKLEGN